MQVFAGMVELADTQDLGSCAERCTGSTPATRTKQYKSEPSHSWRWVRIYCF